MQELQYFDEVASDLYNGDLRSWKEAGNRIVGTVCSNFLEFARLEVSMVTRTALFLVLMLTASIAPTAK